VVPEEKEENEEEETHFIHHSRLYPNSSSISAYSSVAAMSRPAMNAAPASFPIITSRNVTALLNNSNNNPPSPTLTNPDMILPWDFERESSTPSPPFGTAASLHQDINQSMFQPSAPPYQQYHPVHNGYNGSTTPTRMSNESIGVAVSSVPDKSVSSARAVWYEHHDVAPPLSDIGEETEEEDEEHDDCPSESGRVSQDTMRGLDSDSQRSLTPNNEARRPQISDSASNDSFGNEIESEEPVGRASFDSERSNRMSSIVEEEEEEQEAVADEDSDDDIKEAERILENAKKRLTVG
jgi:hypothetical protein